MMPPDSIPPDHVIRRLLAQSIREQIIDLDERHPDQPPEQIAETREGLEVWAEALEQDTTVDEIKRRRLTAMRESPCCVLSAKPANLPN